MMFVYYVQGLLYLGSMCYGNAGWHKMSGLIVQLGYKSAFKVNKMCFRTLPVAFQRYCLKALWLLQKQLRAAFLLKCSSFTNSKRRFQKKQLLNLTKCTFIFFGFKSLFQLLKAKTNAHLFPDLLSRLSTAKFELFLVQAWLIWNQRNLVNHGGRLNKRSRDYLKDFHQAQEQLIIPIRNIGVHIWQLSLESIFKLNFDATIFSELNNFGVGAIICNEKGKMVASMLAKCSPVGDSEEAETLACRKALEFAIDVGFSKLVIVGDNAYVMKSISSTGINLPRLGHIIHD